MFRHILLLTLTLAPATGLAQDLRQSPQPPRPVVKPVTQPPTPHGNQVTRDTVEQAPAKLLRRPTKDLTCAKRSEPFVSELRAEGGSDRVWAGDGDAWLFGGAGEDLVAGGPGSDEVHGGTEADILIGGAGSDRFVFDSPDDSPVDEEGRWSPISGDTIVDFTTPDFDKIDLRAMAKAGPAAPAAFRWSGRRSTAYGVWTQPRAGDTVVLLDVDGDALADTAVRLIGTITIQASSFCGAAALVP